MRLLRYYKKKKRKPNVPCDHEIIAILTYDGEIVAIRCVRTEGHEGDCAMDPGLSLDISERGVILRRQVVLDVNP